MEEPRKINGFYAFYIRNVPIGSVLNKETESKYDTVWSGTWVSKCGELLIIKKNNKDFSDYELRGNKPHNIHMETVEGSLDFVLQKVNEYKTKSNLKS